MGMEDCANMDESMWSEDGEWALEDGEWHFHTLVANK